MNIQKSSLQTIFKLIINSQQSLQVLRQLLNQELSFTLSATFRHLSQTSRPLDVFMIKEFIDSNRKEQDFSCDEVSIENMVKFYSKGGLHLGMMQWASLLLSREDHLLAKITKDRQEIEKEIPQYILNYCRKILVKECHLHASLINLQNTKNWKFVQKISEDNQLMETRLEQLCKDLLPDVQSHYFQLLIRYFKQGETGKPIFKENVKSLFIHTNTEAIKVFINKKQAQFLEKQNKMTISNNPYVHRQFKKLAKNVDLNKTTNLRHVKSIETHLHRNKMPSSSKIIKNIQKYTAFLQQQLRIFCRSFDKIMKLNAHIVQSKRQLLAVNNVNFSLLFSQISKNKEIIPSELQHYLHNLQIDLPLTSLFLLFKRYSDPISGKMNKKQFVRIFKLSNNPKIVKSPTIDKKFRHNTALCLLHEIDYEFKIEEQKKTLMDKVDLRQIFEVIDSNHDKYISVTDLKVIYKKITNSNCKEEYLQEFWWRMGAKQLEMVDYDRFMYELIPRVKEKTVKK